MLLRSRPVDGVFRAVLSGLWFVIIPALFCALAARYLVPRSSTAAGFEAALSSFARAQALLVAVALFVVLSALFRYWRTWLPGGGYLSALPPELLVRVPVRRIAVCEASVQSLRWLESNTAKRWLAASSAELQVAVSDAKRELESELARGKWSHVGAARAKLRALTGTAESRASSRGAFAFVAWLAFAATLAFTIRTQFFRSFEVIGTSMLPSLAPGNVLAGRLFHTSDASPLPARGEVVVLRALVDGRELTLVKRVIGLPGDHIGMRGVHPMINGWPVPVCNVGIYYSPDDETAAAGDPGAVINLEFLGEAAYLTLQAAPAPEFTEYVVKPGEIFVLGDNRSNSRDSRDFEHGVARGFPVRDIEAKVMRVLFGRTRRGDIDRATLLRPLGPVLNLAGLDARAAEAGIERCLAQRPTQVQPP